VFDLPPVPSTPAVEAAPVAEEETPIAPVAAAKPEAAMSPRDALLAKARAFKESQEKGGKPAEAQPQQLSLNMEPAETSLEEARRMAREVLKSPFSNQSLEIPAFIRRKQNVDLEGPKGK
jgi:cell division protein FtsZ